MSVRLRRNPHISGFFALATTLLRMIHGSFDAAFASSALVGILGLALGAVVSVVMTPYSAEESTQWSNLSSAILGAVAGYGIKVLDDSVSYLFQKAHLFEDGIIGARVAIFLASFLFALVYGFSYRRYYVGLDLTLGHHSKNLDSESKSGAKDADT
jgi:hypothetical protein